MTQPHTQPALFLLGQKLSVLQGVAEPDRRRNYVCGDEDGRLRIATPKVEEERVDPWVAIERTEVHKRAAGKELWQRVALVCDAGLGKTTNTQWLAAALAKDRGSRQIPLCIRLDRPAGRRLLAREHRQGNAFARRLAKLIKNAAQGDIDRYLPVVHRAQRAGRITLLIDGLDHALADPEVPGMLAELLHCDEWRHCPIWIAGRPYAFRTCWAELFAAAAAAWQFMRVEPLAEPEIRFYLSWRMEEFRKLEIDWYERLPEGGHDLLRVPRLLQLIAEILHRTVLAAVQANSDPRTAIAELKLQTKADIYYQAYFHAGDYHNPDSRGLLGQGLLGVAEKLGLYGEDPDVDNYPERVRRAGVLLGAIAFEMYTLGRKSPLAPVDGVAAEDRGELKKKVGRRLVRARQGTREEFLVDFLLLTKMNNRTLDFLLFKQAGKNGIVWHSRTVQAFFAAYWAVKFGRPADFQRMNRWKVVLDQKGKRLEDFDEFWQFAAEMPDELVDKKRWLHVFQPCYGLPEQLREKKDEEVQWCRRMVYHSHARMKSETRSPETIANWRAGFIGIQYGNADERRIYREIVHGFRRCPKDPVLDKQRFWMGSPWTEVGRGGDEVRRKVLVGPFSLHEFPVTNEQYELFDPSHQEKRCEYSNENKQPVIYVTLWDAWNFALWCGCRLPTDMEWEYACRGGTSTRYWFGNEEEDLEVHAWYENNSEGRTHAKPEKGDVSHQNANLLYDMLGNVWEWCDSHNPHAPTSHRYLCGGSWTNIARYCRSAIRFWSLPDYGSEVYGFRLAAVLVDGANQVN